MPIRSAIVRVRLRALVVVAALAVAVLAPSPAVAAVLREAPGAFVPMGIARADRPVVIGARSAADLDRVRAEIEARGGHVEQAYPWNALAVTPPASTGATAFAEQVTGLAGVRYAGPDLVVHKTFTPNDTYYAFQWGVKAIGAPAAWDVNQGAGVRVAVLDTGVDSSNPDLVGRVVPFRSYVPGVPSAADDDPQSHGTHVAGIIAATMNNNLGVAGVAPGSQVYAYKVLDSAGAGYLSVIAGALRQAADDGCAVASMSFGEVAPANDPAVLMMQSAVDYARSKGVVVVAAVGNDGAPVRFYPAALRGVLGVGAVGSTNVKSSFSNYGAGVVDVVAPGENIWSTLRGSQVGSYSGTSMAAPFAAAVAALLKSQYAALDATQVIDVMQGTAADLGDPGRDDLYGHGLLRADAAVSVNLPDRWEPDGSAAQASTVTVLARYLRTLSPVGDTDVMKVALVAGRTYRFETMRLVLGADTTLDVLDTDGATVLASSDDRAPGDPSSYVQFTAAATGTHYLRVADPRSLGGAYTLRYLDVTAALGTARVSGANRAAGAVAAALTAFPGWTGVTDVVLTSADDRAIADPLSAAGLCGLYRAPLLLTTGAALSPETAAALRSMPGTVTVHIVGGPASVRTAVVTALRAIPQVAAVDRVSGADRYALAVNVAYRMRDVRASRGQSAPDVVLIANGADTRKFFDAMALSPVAAYRQAPILLVKATGVPAATAAGLRVLAPSTVVVGGGPATVSNPVFTAVRANLRWWGATRYDAAQSIAENAIARGWLKGERVCIASQLYDALSAGGSLGVTGASVVITTPSALSSQVGGFLYLRRSTLWGAYIVGNTGSVTPAVFDAAVGQLLQP